MSMAMPGLDHGKSESGQHGKPEAPALPAAGNSPAHLQRLASGNRATDGADTGALLLDAPGVR